MVATKTLWIAVSLTVFESEALAGYCRLSVAGLNRARFVPRLYLFGARVRRYRRLFAFAAVG